MEMQPKPFLVTIIKMIIGYQHLLNGYMQHQAEKLDYRGHKQFTVVQMILMKSGIQAIVLIQLTK